MPCNVPPTCRLVSAQSSSAVLNPIDNTRTHYALPFGTNAAHIASNSTKVINVQLGWQWKLTTLALRDNYAETICVTR